MAVIQKQSPEFKSDEDRSDDYINARFDSVVELLDTAEKENGAAGLAKVIRDAKEAGSRDQGRPPGRVHQTEPSAGRQVVDQPNL